MENEIKRAMQSIEGLCLENEILRLLLQENWPVAQKLSPRAVLSHGCREHEEEFRSRNKTSDTRLSPALSVPAPCQQILEALSEWIEQIREKTIDRVEQARETL